MQSRRLERRRRGRGRRGEEETDSLKLLLPHQQDLPPDLSLVALAGFLAFSFHLSELRGDVYTDQRESQRRRACRGREEKSQLTSGDVHDVLREGSESCEFESVVSFGGGTFDNPAKIKERRA